MKFKIAIVSIITCLLALPAMAETKTHVVERGETIASIAKHYGITEKALLAENPTAADFFYTGMVLTIPRCRFSEWSIRIFQNISDARRRPSDREFCQIE